MDGYGVITVSKDDTGRFTVAFQYNPLRVQKVKTINGHRWHPTEKYRSFPDNDGTLEKILRVFEDEEIHIDPALKGTVPDLRTEQSGVVESGLSPQLSQDLRRELVSRKYSYKTVKGYLYYNRDFLSFVNKQPSEINDNDIKDYLTYLVEEKQAATSTLNQAINALKFYYGTMLRRKFLYDIKRPRKDKRSNMVSGLFSLLKN